VVPALVNPADRHINHRWQLGSCKNYLGNSSNFSSDSSLVDVLFMALALADKAQ
jgi:hypothetical protein